MEAYITQSLMEAEVEGLPEEGLQAGHLEEHVSMNSLRNWAKDVEGTVCLINLPAPGDGFEDCNVLTYSEGNQAHECYIVTFSIPLQEGAHTWDETLVMVGDALFGSDIRALPFHEAVTVIKNPTGSFPESSLGDDDIGGTQAVIENRVVVAVCNDKQLLTWLEMQNVNQQEGMLACMYHLFPYMRDWLKARTVAVDYAIACRKKGVLHPPNYTGDREAADIHYRMRTSIFLLGPSYSRDSKIAPQIQRRGKAAAQSLGLDFPTAEDVAGQITATGWSVSDRTGLMDDALGAMLARGDDMTVDHDISYEDLKPIQELIDENQASAWGAGLLTQARMVYESAHAKTLSMAMTVEPLVRTLLQTMHAPWSIEDRRVQNLIKEIQGKPFTGLRGNLADSRQISHWPRMALIGLLHHRRTLETSEKKAEFDQYNIEGVEEKINSAQDKMTCRTIAETIPDTNILGLTSVVAGVPLEAARSVMDPKSADVKGGVLKRLIATNVVCGWRTFYYGELVKLEMKRVRGQAVGIVDKILREKMASLRSRAENELEPQVARDKRVAISEFEQMIQEGLTGGNPISDTLEAPEDAAVQEAYTNEIRRLEALVTNIRNLRYDNLGH